MKNNKGFSLVELIVVIAIMAILAAVAIPTFATFINKANVASDVSFINDLEYSAQLAHAASGDKIKENSVQVTLNNNGSVSKVVYTVLDVKNDGTTTEKGDVTISVTSGTPSVVDTDAALAKDAAAVLSTIDWTYNFKSEKTGSWQLDSDEDYKALETVAPADENP